MKSTSCLLLTTNNGTLCKISRKPSIASTNLPEIFTFSISCLKKSSIGRTLAGFKIPVSMLPNFSFYSRFLAPIESSVTVFKSFAKADCRFFIFLRISTYLVVSIDFWSDLWSNFWDSLDPLEDFRVLGAGL